MQIQLSGSARAALAQGKNDPMYVYVLQRFAIAGLLESEAQFTRRALPAVQTKSRDVCYQHIRDVQGYYSKRLSKSDSIVVV